MQRYQTEDERRKAMRAKINKTIKRGRRRKRIIRRLNKAVPGICIGVLIAGMGAWCIAAPLPDPDDYEPYRFQAENGQWYTQEEYEQMSRERDAYHQREREEAEKEAQMIRDYQEQYQKDQEAEWKLYQEQTRTGLIHTKYVLKLDVRKCYPTMNHEELRKKLQRRIKDKKFLRLADRIIASFQQPMATHERLLPETDAVGIPVGLFTSPWFCNFFFQDIDHKVAEKTGAAHNVRYVDDMVLFDSNKRRLHKALEFIEAEVKATKQTVKDNWQVFILSKRPLDFLGFKFHPNKTTIRKSIMLRISRKARTIARAAYASIRNAHAMVSYIGYIVNSDSQRFYEKWVRPFVNIKHLKGVIADEDRKQHQACVAV